MSNITDLTPDDWDPFVPPQPNPPIQPSDVPEPIPSVVKVFAEAIIIRHGSYIEATEVIARLCLHHPDVGMDRFHWIYKFAIATLDKMIEHLTTEQIQVAHDIRYGIKNSCRRGYYRTGDIRSRAYRISDARMLRSDCDSIVDEEVFFSEKTQRTMRGRVFVRNPQIFGEEVD